VQTVVHSVVISVNTNYAQGLDRVLSGCLRNPVCPTRFRVGLPSQLTISRDCLGRSPPLLLRRDIKPHCQYHKMFLLAGGSIRNATVVAIDTHDLGPGA